MLQQYSAKFGVRAQYFAVTLTYLPTLSCNVLQRQLHVRAGLTILGVDGDFIGDDVIEVDVTGVDVTV